MPRISSQQLDEMLRRNPSLAKANPALGGAGLCPNDTQSTQGHALECAAPRKEQGRPRTGPRTRIRFTVFSTRPADWDGYSVKELQDMLCHAGILSGDKWSILQGEVVSEKAHTKAEERTVVEIEWPQ